jgi:tetratricopeptide (TPR) repeat protein
MERYPEQTTVTIEELRNSGWREALASGDRKGYFSMLQSLSAAADLAIGKGLLQEGSGLRLLADACSMMLTPSSINEPFKPSMVMKGKRSSLPIDFQQDVDLFAAFAEEVDDPWLQGRLADLVWLLTKPGNPKHALLAIDAYRQLPLDSETWIRGSRECWQRAISLALMLKAGAGDRLKEIEATLIAAFESSKKEDGCLALELSGTLASRKLGHAHHPKIVAKLEALARAFDVDGNFDQARDYFDAASRWFQQTGNIDKAAAMTVCLAEGWVKEAVARLSCEQPSNTIAASCYENAIQTYRNVPRSERNAHRVDERIVELHKHLSDAGAKSLDEMEGITTPTIDISDIVELTINAVKGKPTLDALDTFANICRGARAKKIQGFSEKMLREHPLQALISATHISHDGRVIAKRPGMGFGNIDSREYKTTLWAEMVKRYTLELGLNVLGEIWPALEILRLEHRLRADDFIIIANRSPIVPTDRKRLFGLALFAGYDNDFVVALHILVPQIEHMVRWHLKNAGVKTTTLNTDGLETENGLSKLIELPEVTQIFGEDLAFEFKALFCDAFGPNLRNELAHGLLTDQECQSTYAIYAWWLGFKIVFNPFWNVVRKAHKPNEDSQALSTEI